MHALSIKIRPGRLLPLLSICFLAMGCPWERDNPLDREGENPPRADGGGGGGSIPGLWNTIYAGSFQMGSPDTESCRTEIENLHGVTLSRSFRIMIAEVTQTNFQAVMGYNPAKFSDCGGSCPVDHVSWHMAAAYCNALSARGGRDQCYDCSGSEASVTCATASAYKGNGIYSCPGYRLPTEAEWEYAYRAGSSSAFYNGAPEANLCNACNPEDSQSAGIARYCGNSTVSYSTCLDKTADGMGACSGPSPIQTRQKNAWGLYDMAGNVYEWCHDRYRSDLGTSSTTDPVVTNGSFPNRIARGGGWLSKPKDLRAAARISSLPNKKYVDVGLRVVRSLLK